MRLKFRSYAALCAVGLGIVYLVLAYFIKPFKESKTLGNILPLKSSVSVTQQHISLRRGLDGDVVSVPTGNKIANAEIVELLSEKFDNGILRRRRRRRKMVLNETNADSNRALEEQDDVFDKLLDEADIERFSMKSKRFRQPDPNLKVRYLRECKGIGKWNHYVDHRKKYPDLMPLLRKMQNSKPRYSRVTLKEAGNLELEKDMTVLEKFNLRISNLDMYEENDTTVDILLNKMATMPIVNVREKGGGTQLKLLVTFQDGSQALLKPMRFGRNHKTNVNHFYFNYFERHTSEIAAFHLDRILGFRRCVPVVGRELSIVQDIYRFADDQLLKTFFVSPGGNLCFHGNCKQYCDTSHAICGKPNSLEVSLAALLPSDPVGERARSRHPWRRSYHKRKKAEWETRSDYCELIRQQPIYNNTKLLADIVDGAIFDFLIGNMDRHHYEVFKTFGNDSFILHLDNGRGFGVTHDEYSILAPLYQCCFVHQTTFRKLMQIQQGKYKLSTLMFCSLYKDPVSPILLDEQLDILDRRLEIIIQLIRACAQNASVDKLFFSPDN